MLYFIGSTVYIHGIPIGERFNIDFVARNGAILFHYNPRFKEKKVLDILLLIFFLEFIYISEIFYNIQEIK